MKTKNLRRRRQRRWERKWRRTALSTVCRNVNCCTQINAFDNIPVEIKKNIFGMRARSHTCKLHTPWSTLNETWCWWWCGNVLCREIEFSVCLKNRLKSLKLHWFASPSYCFISLKYRQQNSFTATFIGSNYCCALCVCTVVCARKTHRTSLRFQNGRAIPKHKWKKSVTFCFCFFACPSPFLFNFSLSVRNIYLCTMYILLVGYYTVLPECKNSRLFTFSAVKIMLSNNAMYKNQCIAHIYLHTCSNVCEKNMTYGAYSDHQ